MMMMMMMVEFPPFLYSPQNCGLACLHILAAENFPVLTYAAGLGDVLIYSDLSYSAYCEKLSFIINYGT